MPYLRNAWYAAGWASEVGDQPLARTFLDEPVVIYRAADGQPTALSDMCPHRFAPLSLGRVDGDNIRCPYHGLVFDKTGGCIHNPHGKGMRPSSLSLRTYPLVVQQGMMWIWMGDPAAAANTPPPSYSFLDDENLTTLTGYLHVNAYYELVTDNLMDLTHAEFLHPFIAPEGSASATVYGAEQEGERVGALHSMPNTPNTPLMVLLTGEHVKRIDGYANTYWEAPSNMYIETGVISLDTPERQRWILPQVHLLTPETETSTHYFWAASRGNEVDPKIDDMLQGGLAYAFQHEDEPMIQAVQARMRNRPLFDLSPALLPQDEAAVRVRRILARRIEAEQAASSERAAVA